MPTDLKNTPETLILIINNLFVDILDEGLVVFLYDILIYSNTAEESFKKVFTHLYKHVFYCRLKKCTFLQNTTTFLGFYITLEGMYISDTKVRSLKKYQKPTTA